MFVFPAFNESYKTRKRTFRCCTNCRLKRIRCSISDSSYETNGCDNCKSQNVQCDLVKAPKKSPNKKAKTSKTSCKTTCKPKIAPEGFTDSPSNRNISLGHTPMSTKSSPSTVASDVSSFTNPPAYAKVPSAVPMIFEGTGYGRGNPELPPAIPAPMNRTGNDLPLPIRGPTGDSSHLKSLWDLNLLPQGQPESLQKGSSANMRSLPGLPVLPPQSFSSPYTYFSFFQSPSAAPNDSTGLVTSKPPVGSNPNTPTNDSRRIPIAGLTSEPAEEERTNAPATMLPPNSERRMNIVDTYSSLMDSIEEVIPRIDHNFLKNTFNFNSTFRSSRYHFTKAVKRKLGVQEPETNPVGLAPNLSKKSKFLDKSNILHFKFLLNLHAFTLDTPGFYSISDEDLVKLFEIYFYKVNSVFPIVFEAEFWELHKRGRIPNVILYAVILIAARDELSEPILARSFTENNATFEENCARFLKELEMKTRQLLEFVPELGDTEKLARLITQLLLSLNFKFNKFGNEQSSSDMGDCISYAYSLLIHNEYFHDMIAQMGAIKKSVYLRRLWWVIFIFDRFNAILNGKAMFIKRLDFNVQRPRDLPHLDSLVGLAYNLEDTMVAGFRPHRNSGTDGPKVASEYSEGDPVFDPSKIITDEISVLEDTAKLESVFSIDEPSETTPNSHLPDIDMGVYRDRFAFFLERLVRHQIILILRTGQFKVLREASYLDTFSLKLSKTLLSMFHMLQNGQGLKLVMVTPIIPSMLLVAFSVPSFARYSLLHPKKEKKVESPEIVDQIVELSDGFLFELKRFSSKWWFVHEVIESFVKNHPGDGGRSTKELLGLNCIIPKKYSISINSLVRDASDAECVLPSSLSITSPGFYDEVMVKEESDTEDDDPAKKQNIEEGKPQEEHDEAPRASVTPKASSDIVDSSRRTDVENDYFQTQLEESTACSTENASLADDLYFDVAQLAEMVSNDTNFIPNVMDYFPDSSLDFFF